MSTISTGSIRTPADKIRTITSSGSQIENDDTVYCDGDLTFTLIDPAVAKKKITLKCLSGTTTIASVSGSVEVTRLTTDQSITLTPESSGWLAPFSYKTNVPLTGRGFKWAVSNGDNAWNGLSNETAKKTLQGCIDAVNALVPLPPLGGSARITTIEDDVISAPIVLPETTTIDALGVAIIGSSAGPMLTMGGNRQATTFLDITNTGTGATIDFTDMENVSLDSQFIGSFGGGSGVDISGVSENVFIKALKMQVKGGGSAFKIRGTASTPYVINVDSVDLDTVGDTLIDYSPDTISEICTVNVTSVVRGVTGTCIFTVNGGTIDISSQTLVGDKLALVAGGSQVGLDVNEVVGDLEVNDTSIVILKSVGFMVGDIVLADTSTCYFTCSAYIGDITAPTGTTLYVNIKNHTGSILDDSGTINGTINGEHYGNWELAIADIDGLQSALDLKQDLSEKGAANGYAPLNASALIDSIYLPGMVKPVQYYVSLAAFPVTGEDDVIYVAEDTTYQYGWSGAVYIALTDATALWGGISGSLANQADLVAALAGKKDDFSENTAFNKNFGTSAGTVAEGLALAAKANRDGDALTSGTYNGVDLKTNQGLAKFLNGNGDYTTLTSQYAELFADVQGSQKLKDVDEVMVWSALGLSNFLNGSVAGDKITVPSSGRYDIQYQGSAIIKRDVKYNFWITATGGIREDLGCIEVADDNMCWPFSFGRILELDANDEITITGQCGSATDKDWKHQLGTRFKVIKL